jgi:undecaprenyl diphosphate synthase
MSLLRRYLKKETANLVRQNIKFSVVGDLGRLPTDLLSAIDMAVNATKKNTGLNLTFALSYGSRWEIVETAKKLAALVKADQIQPSQIDEATFNANLLSAPAPDLDLIIRTSGEARLSNFMLWQAAYAELAFTDTLWPDFNVEELGYILMKFLKTERRFGGVSVHENIFN